MSEIDDGCDMTLLEYAARRRCHPIVGRLLLAGADPRVRATKTGRSPSCPTDAASSGVPTSIKLAAKNADSKTPRGFLQSYPLQYGAYIVNQVLCMRDAGEAAIARQASSDIDPRCEACCESAISEPVLVTTAPEASSLWCENCLWDYILEGDPLSDHEPILQPLANTPADSGFDMATLRRRLTDAFVIEKGTSSESPAIDAKLSLRRFKELPEALAYNAKPKKPKLRALSKRELRAFALGDTRAKRAQHWWRAASEGDHLRLRALLDVGVDAGARDENGETALMMAQGALLARLSDVRRSMTTNETVPSSRYVDVATRRFFRRVPVLLCATDFSLTECIGIIFDFLYDFRLVCQCFCLTSLSVVGVDAVPTMKTVILRRWCHKGISVCRSIVESVVAPTGMCGSATRASYYRLL